MVGINVYQSKVVSPFVNSMNGLLHLATKFEIMWFLQKILLWELVHMILKFTHKVN